METPKWDFGILYVQQIQLNPVQASMTQVWMLLIAMEESRQKSYAEVANVLYGTRAGIIVDVTIALYNFGVLVSYATWLQFFSRPFFWAIAIACIDSLLIGGKKVWLLPPF